MAKKAKTDLAILSWRAPEFFYYPKNSSWFVWVPVLAVIITIVLYFLGELDWTVVLLVIAGAFAMYRQADKKPRMVQIKINPEGVQIDERTYSYDDLKSFQVVYHGNYASVDFIRKRIGTPISALTGEQDVDQIREVLGKYLAEENTRTEFINDRISRWLRF